VQFASPCSIDFDWCKPFYIAPRSTPKRGCLGRFVRSAWQENILKLPHHFLFHGQVALLRETVGRKTMFFSKILGENMENCGKTNYAVIFLEALTLARQEIL
jgi:hypothetical protein